jgi:hypothetical protein
MEAEQAALKDELARSNLHRATVIVERDTARAKNAALNAEIERLRQQSDEEAERCIRLMGEVSTLREENAALREVRAIMEQLRELLAQAKGE